MRYTCFYYISSGSCPSQQSTFPYWEVKKKKSEHFGKHIVLNFLHNVKFLRPT